MGQLDSLCFKVKSLIQNGIMRKKNFQVPLVLIKRPCIKHISAGKSNPVCALFRRILSMLPSYIKDGIINYIFHLLYLKHQFSPAREHHP